MALAALGDKETPLAAFPLPAHRAGRAPNPWQYGRGRLVPAEVACRRHTRNGSASSWTRRPCRSCWGWKLWKLGWLSRGRAEDLLRQDAEAGGRASWSRAGRWAWAGTTRPITPPFTQQERWEEQGGYSPSTTAAVIAGLVVAGDIADLAGDNAGAEVHREPLTTIRARSRPACSRPRARSVTATISAPQQRPGSRQQEPGRGAQRPGGGP
ncbi:glycoside hydrolase family 15 protein [Caulobacter segnis]